MSLFQHSFHLLLLLCCTVYAGGSFDISTLDGSNGVRIRSTAAGASIGESLSGVQDLDGDGRQELLIGAPSAGSGGRAYLYYGASLTTALLNVASLDGSQGTVVEAAAAGEELGTAVRGGGDFNNDGIADFAVSAPGALGGAGIVCVFFGTGAPLPYPLNCSYLDGSNGFVYRGSDPGYGIGESLELRDISGDGIADLIVGVPNADPGGLINAGEYHVLYGDASWSAATFDASSLDGSNGFRGQGDTAGDELGTSLCAGSDLNGDSIADLAIGAPGGDPGGFGSAGDVYVQYGGSSLPSGSTFLMSAIDGVNGFIAEGGETGGRVGDRQSLACGGDYSGDAQADLAIGSWGAVVNPGGLLRAGKIFIVYGRSGSPGVTLGLLSIGGADGSVLHGEAAFDEAGSALALGDSRASGQHDLLIGAPRTFLSGSGTTYTADGPISSNPTLLADIDGGPVSGTVYAALAADDTLGTAVAFANVNGDGSDDAIFSAPLADVGGSVDSGEVYVVFGATPTETPSPTITPTATTTATITPTISPTATATPLPPPGWRVVPGSGSVNTLFSFEFFGWDSLPGRTVAGYNVEYEHDGIVFSIFSEPQVNSSLLSLLPAGSIPATGLITFNDGTTQRTDTINIDVALPPGDVLDSQLQDIETSIANNNIDDALQSLLSITTLLLPDVEDVNSTIDRILELLDSIKENAQTLSAANSLRFTYIVSVLTDEIQGQTLLQSDPNSYVTAVQLLDDYLDFSAESGVGVRADAAQLALQTASHSLQQEDEVELTAEPFFELIEAIQAATFVQLSCDSQLLLSAEGVDLLLTTENNASISLFDTQIELPESEAEECGAVSAALYRQYPFGQLCDTRQSSDVLSVTVHDGSDAFRERSVQSLDEPIAISLPLSVSTTAEEGSCSAKDESVELSCVFFDRELGCWSDSGCRLADSSSSAARCECNHLTDFSVLASVREGEGGCGSANDSTAFTPLVIASIVIIASALLTVSAFMLLLHKVDRLRWWFIGSEAKRVEILRNVQHTKFGTSVEPTDFRTV